MKAFRIVYFTLMGLLLLMGRINGIRAYYILFFFQLMLLLICLGLNLWTAWSFAYVQNVSALRYVKGGFARLHVEIHNDKPFPFTMLRVHLSAVSPSDGQVFTINLMPHTNYKADFDIPLPYRGEYEIGISHIIVTDVFGLCSIRFNLRRMHYYKPVKITVYPRLVELLSGQSGSGDVNAAGGLQLALSPQGDAFAGTRRYVPGDAAKHIHWKTTLHRRELHAKVYDIQPEAMALLVVNNAMAPDLEGEDGLYLADGVCESALAVAHMLLQGNHPVRLADASMERAAIDAGGPAGFEMIYSWLALLPFDAPQEGCTRVIATELGRRNYLRHVFLFTPTLDVEAVKFLRSLAANAVDVTCVFVDAQRERMERMMPPQARSVFLESRGRSAAALEDLL